MPKKNKDKKIVPKKSRKSVSLENDNTEITNEVGAPTKTKLSNVIDLSIKSLKVIYQNWRIFSLVSLIYLLLTLLFVRGFSSTLDVSQLKNSYLNAPHQSSLIGSSLSVFGNMISSGASSSSGSGNIYQSIFFVIFSLVFIWMLRELLKGNHITLRDSLYKSQSSLIPFIIVVFFVVLELIPMVIGLFLYTTVFGNGIAVHVAEKVVWLIISLGFVVLSLFFLVSSIFAIYIVTLPDVRPIQALRSAWQLVKGRRAVVFRKILFLPVMLFLIIGLISVIFIILIPSIADFVFFALGAISLPITQSYLYNLYRELL